jgi:hypothetical protein
MEKKAEMQSLEKGWNVESGKKLECLLSCPSDRKRSASYEMQSR